MSGKRDYYEVLGLNKTASEAEIKKSFRSLARKFHPDKNQNDSNAESRFKELQEAYAILSNPQQRRNYDMFGHDSPGGSPFGPSGFQSVNINFDDLFGGGFDSLFSQFFGGQEADRENGSDILFRHKIPFQVAMDGANDQIQIEVKRNCNNCDGRGSSSSDGFRQCPSCDGRGRIDEISMIGPFRQRIRKDCNSCRGSGRIVTDPCTICKGEGRSFQSSKVNFLISPGVRDGTRLRIRSQGESSTSINGNPGDLFIELDLEPHPWFERDGPDLLMALPLSYADLSLGADIEIPHLDSQDLRISVPPGSRPGDTILIPDRGLPSHRGIQNRGSVTAVLKLAMPKKNSRKMRKKISEIRDEMEEELETLENRILLEAKKRRRS